MSRNYTGLGRYEQLFDQFDAAISRLESRCDKIERRVTNLSASKATYGQHHYVDFDSRRPRRRPTCWDPLSRTSARRVGEIRAPPLPEPPPQLAPDLLYDPTPCRTSDTYASEHTTRSYFRPWGFIPADSVEPHHSLTTISNHSHTPSQPQLVLAQKPPPQLVLDQHPPTPRPRSYQRPAPICTVSENSSASTTQSRPCHEQPPVVLQPPLSPTNLRRSAISPMASTAAPPPQLPLPPSYRCPSFVTDKSSATRQTDVYRTRRSARFIERGAMLLQGVPSCLEKDLYTNEVLDFKMNLEESWDRSVEVAGVTDVKEPENKVEGQVYTLNQTPNTFSSFDPYLLSLTILSMEEMHADILPYTLSLKARGGFFVNMSFARMRGVECRNSSETVAQNGLLKAQCLIFMRSKEWVKHSLPIGGFLREDHPDEKELLLVQDYFKDMDGEVQRLLLERDKDTVGQVLLEDLDIAMVNRHLSMRWAKETFKLTRSRLFSKSSAWNDFLPVIAFDPGGKISKFYYHRLCSLFRGSHLEDKVDFNRGGRRNDDDVRSRCMIQSLLQVPAIKDDFVKTKAREERGDVITLAMLVGVRSEMRVILFLIAFDPGGDASMLLLSSTLPVVPWFPP